MATIQETLPVEKKSSSDCYDAFLEAMPRAGFKIFKERAIVYLLMGQYTLNGEQVDCNLMAKPGSPTQVSITVTSEAVSEADLRPLADKMIAALKTEL
ncbi:MAG: hypothetical protein HGA86_08610, partial [Anaerolineaceae bacterium]|nr:hypothetical protein [Anaerolineaceae bacterium]